MRHSQYRAVRHRGGKARKLGVRHHDAGLALAMSSLEIAVRERRELRFITHIDIIRKASTEARVAVSPLSIPIPACEPAWNKDPVFGVIGIQSGPRG